MDNRRNLATGSTALSEMDRTIACEIDAQEIAKLIASCVNSPSDALPRERELAAALSVGCIGKEIVQYPTDVDYALKEMREARLTAVRNVGRTAVKRIGKQTPNRLRRTTKSQKASTGEPIRFLISDRTFHAATYQAGRNAALTDVPSNLFSYLPDHRRKIVVEPGSIAISVQDHKTILTGLETGVSETAATALAAHETLIYTTTQHLLGSSP